MAARCPRATTLARPDNPGFAAGVNCAAGHSRAPYLLLLNPDAELQAVILRAVEAQKKTKDWLKDGGQYVPHPASWLNGERWQDEIGPISTITGGTNAGSNYAEVPSN